MMTNSLSVLPLVWTAMPKGAMDAAVDMQPLFEAILRHATTCSDPNKPLQLQVTTLDYSDYVGRIVIGKIHNGVIRMGQQAALMTETGEIVKAKSLS